MVDYNGFKQSKRGYKIELPDVALALIIFGFIAYLIYAWVGHIGLSALLAALMTMAIFSAKILGIFAHIIRTARSESKSDSKPVDPKQVMFENELKKYTRRLWKKHDRR